MVSSSGSGTGRKVAKPPKTERQFGPIKTDNAVLDKKKGKQQQVKTCRRTVSYCTESEMRSVTIGG
jgi:hypothetical protein